MDNVTFALFVLGFGTILIAIIIWQIFTIARTRMQLNRTEDPETTKQTRHAQQQLDARLSALVEDVEAIERRVTKLEPPERS